MLNVRRTFEFDDEVRIQAFFGGQEYTELEAEAADEVQDKTVVVMTPEKCSLALRRSPEVFENLSLLIMDECHLLGEDGSRGVGSELVIAHILSYARASRTLFLSALLANPVEIAAWLEEATEEETVAISSDWRPTRTLRGFVGIASEPLERNRSIATQDLADRSDYRKNEKFESPYRLLFGLQGVWDQSRRSSTWVRSRYGRCGLSIWFNVPAT